MKVVTINQNLYREVTEYDYTPTPAELHYWYSGTHAGTDPDNPYAPLKGMTVTKVKYVPEEA